MNDRLKNIWILEDDPGCIFVYEEILSPHYQITIFNKIEHFDISLCNQLNSANQIDLAIVDLQLPDGNFLDYLSKANPLVMKIPFIVVSSNDEVLALHHCFYEGALDYLVKPFKKSELLVKVERILNGNYLQSKSKTTTLPLNANSYNISNNSENLREDMNDNIETWRLQLPITCRQQFTEELYRELTKKERDILSLFSQTSDFSLDRDSLMRIIWKGLSVHPKTLDVHLYNLRKKISFYGIEISYLRENGRWYLGHLNQDQTTSLTNSYKM